MMSFTIKRCAGFIILITSLLAGCAHNQPPLYYWGHYQEEVYDHLKSESADPNKQIAILEADIQKAHAKNQALPPGYYAHLGLLYAQLGKDDQAQQQFETEKTLFPESANFMNFLMRNHKK